jgi:NADH-quinone oxidoreductase subunit G
MPTLTIDNRTVTVPPGFNVLQAAQALGIVIPHYCYHEALGAVGACRFCAMSFIDGPITGLRMSCLVEAADGMVVSTLDPAAQEMRRSVTEWLMINHPHDCPVCDEGGECQLQDMTVASGHGLRRYRGRKRTFNNQDLGPFIEHEMNRCIQCYRCVRTYRDYCGGDDFGVLGVNQRVYFGRFKEGRLLSPFSGNLVDVCPTGVFTDKTFRFRARPWDLQEAPSICPHCSLGCALIPGAGYRELCRVRSGVNRETNGFFICDRGRFGYGHANHPDRPRTPMREGRQVSWDQAESFVREQLAALIRRHGGNSLAFLGSPRASLEANGALLLWSRELKSDRLCFECHPRRDRAARACAAGLGEHARSLQDIRSSDFVLVFGLDPLAEGPLVALAIRQAARAGGSVAVLDPRPVTLPSAFEHLPLQPEKLAEAVSALGGGLLRSVTPAEADVLKSLRKRLQEARRPVLLGGVDLLGPEGVARLLQTAASLSTPERPCGASVVLAGPNSFGGALLAEAGPDFHELLTGIENGRIAALVCLQADPLSEYPDRSRVESALAKLELLVVLDCLPTSTVGRATVFLPTTVTAEEEGTFVSYEGRMQRYTKVLSPGLPIRVTGAGDHPPRSFFQETPGDLPRPAWETLEDLAGRVPALEDLRRRIEVHESRFSGLVNLSAFDDGKRLSGVTKAAGPVAKPAVGSESGLRLLVTETLFGSEVLSSYSKPLDAVIPVPTAMLHAQDAAALGIAEGDLVRVSWANGRVELRVRLSQHMARRLVVVPRLRRTVVQDLVPGSPLVPCRLEKGAPG